MYAPLGPGASGSVAALRGRCDLEGRCLASKNAPEDPVRPVSDLVTPDYRRRLSLVDCPLTITATAF